MRALKLTLAMLALPALTQGAERVLTLNEALATARDHQPQIQQAHASSAAAAARVAEVKSTLLPQVSGNAAYQRSTDNYVARPGSLPRSVVSQPSAASTWATSGFYTFGFTASQLVWDFGAATARWHGAQATAAAQQDDERTVLIESQAAVRTAFFQARAARGLVAVATETLANQNRHLSQAQAFVEVGTRPEIDLAQARADTANARVQLINAQNQYETAKAQINQAMGVEGSTDYDVSDEMLPAVPGEDEGIENLLGEAFVARPEVAAAEDAIRAQQFSVRAARGDFWPSISASTSFIDAGGRVDNLAWNWSASLDMSVPLLRGGQVRAQVREAEWNLEALKAQAATVRQQVRLEIEQARLAVRAAKAALEAAGEALTNAQEQLKLAEGRYETGVGNIIELGDAQVAHTSAAQQQVQAEYQLATARAQLLRSMGRI